jgi:hypothetical protein
MKIASLATLCCTCLLGILPIAAFAQPYVISTDGNEVTDQKTGLIWRRCAEGMSWNGTTCSVTPSACAHASTVTPATFTHEEALKCATTISAASLVPWRLPNVKELSSITDIRSIPALDSAAFPATPAGYFWSASPYVVAAASAWYVNSSIGDFSISLRTNTYYVRLVRAGQ